MWLDQARLGMGRRGVVACTAAPLVTRHRQGGIRKRVGEGEAERVAPLSLPGMEW